MFLLFTPNNNVLQQLFALLQLNLKIWLKTFLISDASSVVPHPQSRENSRTEQVCLRAAFQCWLHLKTSESHDDTTVTYVGAVCLWDKNKALKLEVNLGSESFWLRQMDSSVRWCQSQRKCRKSTFWEHVMSLCYNVTRESFYFSCCFASPWCPVCMAQHLKYWVSFLND